MTSSLQESISWIDGHWGRTTEVLLPISDRGLTLGDGIFETILIYEGKAQLLTKHLNRWQKSASILHMASPPVTEWLMPLIDEAIKRSKLHQGIGALRLNWSRGDNLVRGINIQAEMKQQSNHRFWLEIYQIQTLFNSISTIISHSEQRNSNSLLSQCKTFGYGQSIQARYEANRCGSDEALLLSTNGQLCCGSTANLLVKRGGQWLTPPLGSGCLPGIMRQQALESGLVKEAEIKSHPYPDDKWLLINSLSCRPIKQVNQFTLEIFRNPKKLWLSLLKATP